MEQKDNHNMDDAMIKSELIPQFVASLEESIRRNYEMDVTVEKSTTLKTNMEADIFVVHFKDSNIAPTIYLNDILNYHRNGMSIEVISEEMSKAVVRAYWNSPVLPKFTAEEAKKSITLTLINAEKNKKLLQNVPHFLVGDVAAIPRWYLSDNTSFVVTNDMAGKLMLTGEEILQIGQQSVNNTKFEIIPMTEMLNNLKTKLNLSLDEMETIPMGTEAPELIIMTNINRLQGANAILSKEALMEVSEKFHGKPYYILPSSCHEVICISTDSGVSSTYLRREDVQWNLLIER